MARSLLLLLPIILTAVLAFPWIAVLEARSTNTTLIGSPKPNASSSSTPRVSSSTSKPQTTSSTPTTPASSPLPSSAIQTQTTKPQTVSSTQTTPPTSPSSSTIIQTSTTIVATTLANGALSSQTVVSSRTIVTVVPNPTAATSNETPSKKPISMVTIIAPIVGALAVIGTITVLCLCFKRRKCCGKRKQRKKTHHNKPLFQKKEPIFGKGKHHHGHEESHSMASLPLVQSPGASSNSMAPLTPYGGGMGNMQQQQYGVLLAPVPTFGAAQQGKFNSQGVFVPDRAKAAGTPGARKSPRR
ncbi:hypothetical protein B0J14DRAFT_581708 [Halenospora varia]|nr:hypothetical protein B0J14DRAFT_581708 [Halenospora varia]